MSDVGIFQQAEMKDYLGSLPAELLHMIISYLFPTHHPDKAFWPEEIPPFVRGRECYHPLDFLAATSKSLRAEVMDWARIWLKQHQDITRYITPVTAKEKAKEAKRSTFLRGRGGLLRWKDRNCVFCGHPSTRSALLMNGLRCCAACDEVQWPGKITKSDARNEYDLKDHHLLPHLQRTPISAKMLAKHPGLPKLTYGTYMVSGVPTTMFLRKDVEALARLAHGDLVAHLAKRKNEREERSRKIMAAKQVKRAESKKLEAHVTSQAQLPINTTIRQTGSSAAQAVVIISDDDDADDEEFDIGPAATNNGDFQFDAYDIDLFNETYGEC